MVAEFSRDQKSSAQIHDFSSQHLKPLGWKRLGEEVCVVVLCANERHHDLLRLDHIAYEEVSPCDMLRPIVMFRVVGKISRRLIVSRQHGRFLRERWYEPSYELPELDYLLGCLRQRDDLGFT